jgi:hypothetical protein
MGERAARGSATGDAAMSAENESSIKSKIENLPIPEALYSCHDCREEYSWSAEDLFWCPKVKQWICINCHDDNDDAHGKATICLKDELTRRVQEVAANPYVLLTLLHLQK